MAQQENNSFDLGSDGEFNDRENQQEVNPNFAHSAMQDIKLRQGILEEQKEDLQPEDQSAAARILGN